MVPNNEKASSWLNKKEKLIKLSDDPIENDLLQSAKKRDDQLTELGKAKVEDGVDITVPQKGVHDAYDWTETGVRTSDDGGIVSAGGKELKNEVMKPMGYSPKAGSKNIGIKSPEDLTLSTVFSIVPAEL